LAVGWTGFSTTGSIVYVGTRGLTMHRMKIVFTGNFWEYFIMSLGLLLLSIITFGLALPYAVYWHAKYFVAHLELEAADQAFVRAAPAVAAPVSAPAIA
jgi:uncharacterized membrane protein YjgN (DUF898 family)